MRYDPLTCGTFSRLVSAAGLRARQCRADHWRIEGGNYDVNYYPTKRQVYINGMSGGSRIVTVDEAIQMAMNGPLFVPVQKHKRGSTKGNKRRMLRSQSNCAACGRLFGPDCKPTLDHVIPLSRGGSDCPDNMVLLCRDCNRAKGNAMPEKARKARP